ncbi:MAG: M1 family metallopeptidase, partial [Bacteroidetes bacterium]|nr:M1 family metallopeptidase [Bacteroidota bacterium]
MKTILAGIILLVLSSSLFAQDPYPVNPNLDVIHYKFDLKVSENNDSLTGKAIITCRMSAAENQLLFDLISENEGKGMKVLSVCNKHKQLPFRHENDQIRITVPAYSQKDNLVTIQIAYVGIPKDGLIISQTKHGKNSYFGDNWPDRARHWLPCVDHVSDKATVEFIVSAPEQYEVIAVGYRKALYPGENHHNITHYVSSVPLCTKVMVIGIADFSIQTAGFAGHIPIESWVYTEDQNNGFLDYAPAVDIVDYFSRKIGPFAFEKLANVQSKTVYGGMENSGAIFYYENSVSGNNRLHSLLAHEIAHQWFGDAVSEADWHHIWLSEGFATYLESVYMSENYQGRTLSERMARSRNRVTAYYQRNPAPVIDTSIVNLRRLLSTNSYQKGAWFLHMLRRDLGESTFWTGMNSYYLKFMNKNALTEDFRHCMEEVSGRNLEQFFNQWLYQAGHPVLKVSHSYNEEKKM